MIRVTLGEADQRLAKFLARERFNRCRDAGVKDMKAGPQDAYMTDLEGVGAELAFCKIANVWPDMTLDPRRGGWDCIMILGLRVDVKATHYEEGKLIAHTAKADREGADIYVLMIGKFPSYRYAGCALASDLIHQRNIDDLGHGEVYCLPQSKLRREMILEPKAA